MVLGDFNAKILPNLNRVVAGKNSPNGKHLTTVIAEYGLKVANFHEKVEGKWTRIQVDKSGIVHKSVLDYMLVQEDMSQSLTRVLIDEDKIFCPYRLKTEKGEKKIVYSDHCTMIAQLKIETGKVPPRKNKTKSWHFSKKGMEKYQVESGESLDIDASTGSTSQSSEAYEAWKGGFEKLLSKCFRKVTRRDGAEKADDGCKKHREVRKILLVVKKRGKIQREVVAQYIQRLLKIESSQIAEARAERLKTTMAQLTADEKFSPTGYPRRTTECWSTTECRFFGLAPVLPVSSLYLDFMLSKC